MSDDDRTTEGPHDLNRSSGQLETGSSGHPRKGAKYLRPIGGWLAGIVAAVVAAAVTAWLLTWGVLPGQEPRADPTASHEPTLSATGTTGFATPFTVAVRVSDGIGGWIANQPLAELPARPGALGDGKSWADWARRTGAVPASQSVFFTVQGTSQAQVVLTDLRIRVTERRPAIAGVHVNYAHGGDSAYRWVTADLDTNPPTLSANTDQMNEDAVPTRQRRPITFPYEVSISDAETFLVEATTDGCDCRWVIELSWAAEGHVGTVVVDDNGKPFRVTGKSNVTVSCLTSGDGEVCRAL